MLTLNDKLKIHELCLNHLEVSAQVYLKNIKDAQRGLSSESKSSAGDKHETGRAMLQLEAEKLGAQYQEILKVINFHKQLVVEEDHTHIKLGSLVKTNIGLFYLTTGLGSIKDENYSIFNLSIKAPISKLLLGKKAEEQFVFNNKTIKIISLI